MFPDRRAWRPAWRSWALVRGDDRRAAVGFFNGAFQDGTSVGVIETFLVMGGIYFVSMLVGALTIRIPPPNWKPEGWTPPVVQNKMITPTMCISISVKNAAFYLLWLCYA